MTHEEWEELCRQLAEEDRKAHECGELGWDEHILCPPEPKEEE